LGLKEEIEAKYGGGIISLASEIDSEIIGYPTGAVALDCSIGEVGGFPGGRITELAGPPYSGKTTMSLSVIAEMQRTYPDAYALYIDAENAVDFPYAVKCGVNLERIYMITPEWGEQAFDITERAIRSGQYRVVVIDSIPAISPRAEMEGEIGDAHVALLPRLISQFLRRTAFAIRASGVSVIFTNQVRDKIGRSPFKSYETPGGFALKHHASLRVWLRNAGEVKTTGGESLGSKIAFTIKKNKIGPPYGSGEFEIWSRSGICKPAGVLDMCLQKDIIIQKGAWFAFEDKTMAQGRLQMVNLLFEDLELCTKLEALAHDK